MDQALKPPGMAGPGYRLALEESALLHLQAPRGVDIRVDEGLLWVTQTGRTEDWMIAAGETLRLAHRGCVTVSALGAASLRLQMGTHPWRNWSAVLVHADGHRVRLVPQRVCSPMRRGLRAVGRRLASLRAGAAPAGPCPANGAAVATQGPR